MVRGAEYTLAITVRNKENGEPITDPLVVSGLELALRSSASRVSVKEYAINSGIVSIGDGTFKITLQATDTLLLPATSRAYLEGFTVPKKRSIKIDLGTVYDNQKNYPMQNE
jgi:hypothetical protein